jgi:hypothetical protein
LTIIKYEVQWLYLHLKNFTFVMAVRGKILISTFGSVAMMFLLLVSSFGAVSASSGSGAVVGGYKASNGSGSVTYVSGSYGLVAWGCGTQCPKFAVLVGIDVNPNNPSSSGVQVGVKERCDIHGNCWYRPFFVYGGSTFLFSSLAIPEGAVANGCSCNVFMSIQYFTSSKTMLLSFFDQTTGKSIQQVINAGQYSRSSVSWIANCPYPCYYVPGFTYLYSGGLYTGFSQTDYATISGHYLPLAQLPHLTNLYPQSTTLENLKSFQVTGSE